MKRVIIATEEITSLNSIKSEISNTMNSFVDDLSKVTGFQFGYRLGDSELVDENLLNVGFSAIEIFLTIPDDFNKLYTKSAELYPEYPRLFSSGWTSANEMANLFEYSPQFDEKQILLLSVAAPTDMDGIYILVFNKRIYGEDFTLSKRIPKYSSKTKYRYSASQMTKLLNPIINKTKKEVRLLKQGVSRVDKVQGTIEKYGELTRERMQDIVDMYCESIKEVLNSDYPEFGCERVDVIQMLQSSNTCMVNRKISVRVNVITDNYDICEDLTIPAKGWNSISDKVVNSFCESIQ